MPLLKHKENDMTIEQIQQKYATRIEQLKQEYALRLEAYKKTPQGKHWLEAIKNNDKYLVRSMLKTELTDASVSSDELLFLITLVAKEMPDSLEPYNISKFYEAIKDTDSDQTHWNKEPEKNDGILEKMKKFASDIADFAKENPKKAAIAVLIVVGLVLFW